MAAPRPIRIALIVGIVLCVASGSAALAAGGPPPTGEGTWEVSLNLGYTEWDGDLGNSGARAGVRGGFNFTKLFELDTEISASTDVEILGDRAPLVTGFLNGVFNFPGPQARAVPYVLVGAGWAYTDAGPSDDNGLAYQLAVGAKLFGEKRRVGLRIEGGAMGADVYDENTVSWNLVAGFVFRLGER